VVGVAAAVGDDVEGEEVQADDNGGLLLHNSHHCKIVDQAAHERKLP
jgi:hypothetical protein